MEEKISLIVKEIKEKSGEEWVGLQSTTEKQLESLVWYLEHPRLHEMPTLGEELIELYDNAKESQFTKMEDIIRKIDQLSVKLGKYEYEPPKGKAKNLMFQDYPKEIKDLQTDISILMHSPHGTSLPEQIRKSILAFHNYLNHPDLYKKPELFDEMHEKYEYAKATDFLKLQSFNDLLNKLEIKLGEITEEMKTFKSIKEEKDYLEKEKENLAEEIKKLQAEKELLKKEKEQLKEEKETLEAEKNFLLKEWEEYNELISKLEAKLKKS